MAYNPSDEAERERMVQRVKMEREVRMLSQMMGNLAEQKATVEKNRNPIVVLTENMWPPDFMRGTRCGMNFCKVEEVPRGHFVAIRFRGHVRIVRMMGWKFIENKIALIFIPGHKDHCLVTSNEVELMGEVVAVSDSEEDKPRNPNKSNFFASIWNAATNYGTNGFWKGLYMLIDTFVTDTSTPHKKVTKEKDSIWKMLQRLTQWDKEEKARAIKEEEERKAKAELKRRGRSVGIEYQDDNERIQEDSYDEVKLKLAKMTEAEMDSWWTAWERLKSPNDYSALYRRRRKK